MNGDIKMLDEIFLERLEQDNEVTARDAETYKLNNKKALNNLHDDKFEKSVIRGNNFKN
ncbi:hypothetical protein MXB_3179, partial [Myxobolus squamalis]